MILLILLLNVLACSCTPGDFFDYPDYDDFDYEDGHIIIERPFLQRHQQPSHHLSQHIPQQRQHFDKFSHHDRVVHVPPPAPRFVQKQAPPQQHIAHKPAPPPPRVVHKPAPPPPRVVHKPAPPRTVHFKPPPPRVVHIEEPQPRFGKHDNDRDVNSILVPVRSYHSSGGTSQFNNVDKEGRSRFGFSHPGQVKSEFRDQQGNTHGYFSYSQPSKEPTVVLYKAGPDGFHASSNVSPAGPRQTPEVEAATAEHFRLYNEIVRQRGYDRTAFPNGQK